MRTVLRILLGAWFLSTLALLAEEPAPKQLTIENKYWQILAFVRGVYLDHAGDPWFAWRGGDVAATYDKPLHTLPEDERLLLGDSQGRIWVRKVNPPPTTSARYYDGNKWHETDIKARLATEDAKGRVFLWDATTIHVLDGDQWSRKQIFAQDTYSNPHFLKDAEGRIWFWATAAERFAGTRGLWVFNAGNWLNYTTDNGLPINDIQALLLLDKGRFLVVRHQPNAQVEKKAFNLSIWSPDRTLTAKESAVFPSNKIPMWANLMATDQDGKHYFSGGNFYEDFSVSADGTVAWLLEPESAASRSKFFSGLADKRPPAPFDSRGMICQDRLGRFYLGAGRVGPGVEVVWPSQERSGDILRIAPTRFMRRVLRGPDGTLWGQQIGGIGGFGGYMPGGRFGDGGVVLARWDGAGWQDTPVKIPPHPEWHNRQSPPWHRGYQQPAALLPGTNGSFLAVTVRDVYQVVAAELKKDVAKADEEYWLEAWLLKDGKWLGPQRLDELLRAEYAFLAEHFTTNPRQSGRFSMQSDGKRLWAAYGGKVFVHADGDVTDWSPPERLAGALPESSLCRMPDGRTLWCAEGADVNGLQLFALNYNGARIAGELLPIVEPLPEYRTLSNAVDFYPYATKGGDLWLSLRGDRMLQFREGKWVVRKDLNRPLHEEADGSMWFLSYNHHEDHGYRIVKGDQTLAYPWPADYPLGAPFTPSPSGELHATCGYWLLTLSAAETPFQRKVIKARIIADQHLGDTHAFELEKGRFLFDNGSIGSESQIKVP